MQNPEINSILYNSCEQYYEYLKANNKGLEETKPIAVNYDDLHYRIEFRVRFAPKDMNNLQFRFGTYMYTQERIKILEFDETHKTLLLQLDKATLNNVKGLQVNDITLIDDLKWLVERVRLWYQKNKKDFTLPSVKNGMKNDIIFPPETMPSLQQIDAINAVLSEQVTYIWGAPGTGKTKFVMSYAVANFFKRNYPVLILAPTNHALDQTLSGILPVLEKLNMDLTKVIRLGTATGNMPDKYTFLCENMGKQKELDTIDRQIDALNEQRNFLSKKSPIKMREQLIEELKTERSRAINARKSIDEFSIDQISFFDEPNPYDKKEHNVQIALYSKELAEAEAHMNLINEKLTVLNREILTTPCSNQAHISELEEKIKILDRCKQELLEKMDSNKKYKNKLVVACTLDHCLGHEIMNLLELKHIFLDEAAFACMAKTLPLLTTNTPLTLLGDHMQLPPVCEADEREIPSKDNVLLFWAQSALYLESIFCKTLHELKIEYLDNIPASFEQIKKHNLTESYRFGHGLVYTLDNFVYKIGLSSKLGRETNIYYIHVPEPALRPARKNGTSSRANPEEALVIADLSGNIRNDFVVLTPYKEQVKEITRNAQALARKGQVMTIHKSQGSEWETVIMSVADTANMWFTNTKKRRTRALELINTAVSRAKNELIIVCDYAYWIKQNNQLITELLKNARQWK
jgi:hypothetical protein